MIYAIVGTRTFTDYNIFKQNLPDDIDIIISGGATGTDQLAERYAKEKAIPIIIHKPQWNTYGKAAGPIRNKLIVDDADAVIAFWDYQSKGTKSSIDIANQLNKPIIIVDIR